MAVKAVSLTATVDASSQTVLLSPTIHERHRPVSFLFWISVSATGSWFSAFLTRQPTEPTSPQPGDPDAFYLPQVQTYGTNVFATPLATVTIVDPPVRLALVVNNAAASAARVVATYLYEVV